MKILFVTLSSIESNTSAMIRNNALIKGLINNGCQIDILTIPSVGSNQYYDETLSWDEKINVVRLNGNSHYTSLVNTKQDLLGIIKKKSLPFLRVAFHSLSIFDNTIFSAKKADKKVLGKEKYDLIISSSDPKSSHYAVHQLIKSGLQYGKWVQYWGDPLAIDITQSSIFPKSYLISREKKLFSCADKIVYVSPFTLSEQKKIFPEFETKMSFIPIPYLKEKVYEYQKHKNESLHLVYLGDYNSRIRNIDYLYKVCKKNHLNLVVAGNSDLNLSNTESISIFPRVSQKEVEILEEKSEVLVCILNLNGTQIPGKIYHYAATNKPILVILDGEKKDEIRKYLEKFNRYILCDNDEVSIQSAIKEIEKNKKGYAPSPFFESKNIARQFLNLI